MVAFAQHRAVGASYPNNPKPIDAFYYTFVLRSQYNLELVQQEGGREVHPILLPLAQVSTRYYIVVTYYVTPLSQ